MNYEIWIAGDGGNTEDYLLGVIFREPWERPVVNQQLEFKHKLFTVVRCIPPTNLETDSVKYFLEPYNSNIPFKKDIRHLPG